MNRQPDGLRFDYGRTVLIGLGFLATMAAWAMYNANVPLILERSFGLSTFVIGAVMTIDNVLALFLQPLFGILSDRTVTRWGRRLPYILVGLPVSAALFSLVPRMTTLATMMTVIIAFNLVMSIWRSPNMAFMPDVTPSPQRSMGSAIINLMGGLGGAVSLLGGGLLLDRFGAAAAFTFVGAMMLLAWSALILFVREPRTSVSDSCKERVHGRSDRRSAGRSLILIFSAAFFWFVGYNAIGSFFTLYAVKVLGVTAGTASLMLMLFTGALLVAAVPAGFLGMRCGRRASILIGLSGIVPMFALLSVVNGIAATRIVLALFGLCWALVNINALPMVAEIAGYSRIGRYTGYYFVFMSLAAIVGPTLYGWVRDASRSYGTLFAFAAMAFAMALACMLFVRHGEAVHEAEPDPGL